MKRRICGAALALLCCFSLTGCWNYRGLNDLDIVTGIAVDRNPETGLYDLTFEIADTQNAGAEDEIAAKYVQAQGETIFDTIRNSKKRLINKLYGGNLQTVIISHQIAEQDGVSSVLEELLRDGEPRETLSVVISQEDTAREILLTEGIDSKIIAYEINEMIREDSRVTASTKNLPLYQAYNAIRGPGGSLVLPAARCIENNGQNAAEVNGIALFLKDRLIGYETPENTLYYLFIMDELQNGVISFPVTDPDESVSMQIKSSKASTGVSYENGQLSVALHLKIKLNVMEVKGQLAVSQTQQREQLEVLTEQMISLRISEFFHEIQTRVGVDIFGLGKLLYQKEPEVWRSVEADWESLFQKASLSVAVEADVISSGVMKDY